MYKGCQKKIIVIKSPNSNMFEEAYFIIKENSGEAETKEHDMVFEANKILSECVHTSVKKSRKSWVPQMLFFIMGFITSAIIAVLFAVLYGLFT